MKRRITWQASLQATTSSAARYGQVKQLLALTQPQKWVARWGLAHFALAILALCWAYWPYLTDMTGRWVGDPEYSHGPLVVVFAIGLLWARRGQLANATPGPRLGTLLLVASIAIRAAGTAVFLNYVDGLSFLVAIFGLIVFAAGLPGARWSMPAVAFLGFMLPLPFAVQTGMSGVLQGIATRASTYLLVACGSPAVAEGNTILLINDVRLGIVEACSGLGMLYAFLAVATGAVLAIPSRPVWLKVALVVSSPAVAVGVNVLRITTTGLLYQAAEDRLARLVFHDLAGYLMMPIAILVFAAEVAILERLVRTVTVPREAVAAVAFFSRPSPATAK